MRPPDHAAGPGTAGAARTRSRSPARAARTTALVDRWWVRVLAVYLAARLVSGLVFWLVARTEAATPWTDAGPGYLEYTGLMWDGSWYREIAEQGYPDTLPVGVDGRVQQNPWAFFPLFPLLVRGLMAVTGGPWALLAPLTALVLGGLAMLLVHAAVAAWVDDDAWSPAVRRGAPLLSVALLSTSASAPVLQVAYTESLALLGVAAALWGITRRRYGIAALAVVALGLTRAVALPLVVVAVAHGAARWRAGDLRARSAAAVAGVAGLALASGLAWPQLTAWRTGVPDAYLATQSAWRGRGEVVPLLPWVDVAHWWWGRWGLLVLAAAAGLVVAGLLARPMRRLGPEAWSWTAAYLGYLVLVLEPGTSLVRFALLAFPAWAALATGILASRRPRLWAGVGIGVGILAQVAWIALLWRLVPPSGWPP